MASYLRPRRGSLANAKSQLTTTNPLKSGEVFFECENIGAAQGKIKLGNGSSHYSALPYFLSMQDSSIGFTNSTNSVSTADSSFLDNSILSTSAHSTVMYAVKQLLWNHTQKIAALNSNLNDFGTTSVTATATTDPAGTWYWFRLGKSDWYLCLLSAQATNVACTATYGSEAYADSTIKYPWTPGDIRFVDVSTYTDTGCPVVRVKKVAASSSTMQIRYTNQISITWAAIGVCAIALLKK